MLALIGDEKLQYEFVTSKTNPQVKPSGIIYNQIDKKLVCPVGIIQHMTLGEKKLSSTHELSEFLFWNVKAYVSDVLTEKATAYFLYIKASKTNYTDAVYVLSKDAIEMESVVGYYHFLVATLNSEKDNYRSFTEWYGYTEISPRRMITNLIQSADGKTYFDLANNRLQISSSSGSVVSPSGDSSVIEVDRGGYNSTKTYYVGDKVWYNGIAYVCISNAASTGTPDKDVSKWKPYGQDVKVGGRNLIRGTSQIHFNSSLWGATGWSVTRPIWNADENAIEFSANNGWQASSIALTQPADNQEYVTVSLRVKMKEDYDIVPLYFGVADTAAWTTTNVLTPSYEWQYFEFTFKATGARFNFTIRGVDNSRKNYKALVKDLMFEKANKASSHSDAPEDIEAQIKSADEKASQAKQEAVNAQNSVSNLNSYVDGAFKDGVISEAEAAAIATHLKNVNETMAQLEATYNKLYANSYLEGIAKTSLLNAKINLFGARDNLISAINTAIADAKVTTTEKDNVNSKYDLFNDAIKSFNSAVEDANKAIQDKLDALSTDKVNNIQIGSVNLVDGSATIYSVGGSGSDTHEDIKILDVFASLEEGQTYTVNCEHDGLYGIAHATDTVQIYLYYEKTISTLISPPSLPHTFKAPKTGKYYFRIDSNKGSIKHSFWNFQIEKGNKATDWKLSNNDIKKQITQAQEAAQQAQKSADQAQSTAQESKNRLNEWAKDSVISPTEKTALKQQAEDVKAEYQEISAQATRYNLTTTTEWAEYYSAYTKAIAAFGKYTKATPENIAIDADYSDIANYYPKRQVILDHIAVKSKEYADEVVNNLQISGRNLVRGTSKPYFNQSLWGATGWSVILPLWNEDENAIEFSANNGWQASSIALTQPATNNEYVAISFKAKAKEGFDIVPVFLGVNNSTQWMSTVNFTPTSEWVEQKFIFKATGARLNLTIRGVDSSQKTYKVLIKDLMFERATKTSSYSNAPEDIEAFITEVEKQSKQAQADADKANNILSDISNDNILTPNEKQDVLKEWDIIKSERATVVAQAQNLGLNASNYTVAYNALSAYITSLLANMTANSAITGSEFRTKFKAYYDAKIALLKDVADKAKELADAAKKAADDAAKAANDALSEAQALDYLKKALAGSTTIDGGLLLTSMIQLGIIDAGKFVEKAGINGTAKNDNDVVIWAGGTLAEAQAGNASTVIRLDGTAQLSSNSNGNRIIIDPTNRSITLKSGKDEVLGVWNFHSDSNGYRSNLTLYEKETSGANAKRVELRPYGLHYWTANNNIYAYYGYRDMIIESFGSSVKKIFSVNVNDGVAPNNKMKWNVQGLPTSSSGLKAGDVYIDSNSNLKVVPYI